MRQATWLLFGVLLATTRGTAAQGLPDSARQKIDALFAPWTKTQGPGCSVGVMQGDSLLLAKGYGLANLSYGIPNSAVTSYFLASVSKQFTAYEILLLARQGRLRVDDDIHRYLPWFPNLGYPITIRHLLTHTSGIRDQWQLLSLAGTRLEDVITQAHVLHVLQAQTGLNFKPGTRFNYSNSNYTLLAQIVAQVTGRSFRQASDSLLFKPLGMKQTHFQDDYAEIIPNRATSYHRQDSSTFRNAVLNYGVVGATGLLSNVRDLAKWVRNFYTPTVGDAQTLALLTHPAALADGKVLDYAAGIYSTTYKGWRQYWHDGADAGYRTCLVVFPEQQLGIIVLGNVSDFDPLAKAHQIADLLLRAKAATPLPLFPAGPPRGRVPASDMAAVQKYLGSYVSAEGSRLVIELHQDSLYYRVGPTAYLLTPESSVRYALVVAPEVKISFDSRPGANALAILTPNNRYDFTKYRAVTQLRDNALRAYTGLYHSVELDCDYGIILKQHQLYLTNAKYDATKLSLIGTEQLVNRNWWISSLKVTRNQQRQITGFEVNTEQVAHLRFRKVPCLQPAAPNALKAVAPEGAVQRSSLPHRR